MPTDPPCQDASEQRPHKISFKVSPGSDAVVQSLGAKLKEAGLAVNVIYSAGVDLDLLPAAASKGKALAFLLEEVRGEGSHVMHESGKDSSRCDRRGPREHCHACRLWSTSLVEAVATTLIHGPLPPDPRQMDKGVGRPQDGVLVCGDSGNDIELFAVPGVHGCMVANAHPELRAWCDAHAADTLFQVRRRERMNVRPALSGAAGSKCRASSCALRPAILI